MEGTLGDVEQNMQVNFFFFFKLIFMFLCNFQKFLEKGFISLF